MKQILLIILFLISLLTAKEYAYKTMAPADFNAPSKKLYEYLFELRGDIAINVDIKKVTQLLEQGADPNVFMNDMNGDEGVEESYDEIDACIQKIPYIKINDTTEFCNHTIPTQICLVDLINNKKNSYEVLKVLLKYGLDPNIAMNQKEHGSGMIGSLGINTAEEFQLLIQYGYDPNAHIPNSRNLECFLNEILKCDFNLQNFSFEFFPDLTRDVYGSASYYDRSDLLLNLLNHGLNPLQEVNGRIFSQVVKSKEAKLILQKYELVWKKLQRATIDTSLITTMQLKFDKIKSTSELANAKKMYSIEKLTDSDTTTAWVEGNERFGLNEGFLFQLSQTALIPEKIIIRNGYTKNETIWKSNCRFKRFGITLDSTLIGVVDLEDTPRQQSVNVRDIFTLYKSKLTGKTIGIEIFSIYKGEKYRDIAISEFQIVGTKE